MNIKYKPFKISYFKWRNQIKFFSFDVRFSVNKHGTDYGGSFFVLVDEVKYAYYEEYGPNDSTQSGSATINIELTAGQVVRIENKSSTEIYGTDSTGVMWSWFTGHLLYAF